MQILQPILTELKNEDLLESISELHWDKDAGFSLITNSRLVVRVGNDNYPQRLKRLSVLLERVTYEGYETEELSQRSEQTQKRTSDDNFQNLISIDLRYESGAIVNYKGGKL